MSDILLGQIRSLGGSIISSFPQYRAIRAFFPIDLLENLAASPAVRFIRPAERFVTDKVVSEGDITHRANLARSTFGIKAVGITVGVLSDSVEQLARLQALGDLPPNCPAGPPCVRVLPGQAGSGTSEGTAMMEIINSLAPGSNLLFATGIGGQASLANNILALQGAGAQVIVDDITSMLDPMFQDGLVSQAVNTVAGKGVAYFSSAGNSGNKANGSSGTWEGDYKGTPLPAPVATAGMSALDFGGGNNQNAITMNPSTNTIVLQWSDALKKSNNDYDLYLLNPTGSTVILASTNPQDGTQDPLEVLSYTGDVTNFRLVVALYNGLPRFMHLQAVRGKLQFSTTGGTYGHHAAAQTVGVAAVDVATTGCFFVCAPFVGGTKNPVEAFSSDGPRRIFYNPDGSAITPGNFLSTGGRLLNKPDLTAADGVSTATTGFDPFYGTSAAAPHAAAIAALMLSRYPKLTPADVVKAQRSGSLPVTEPPPGHIAGAGIVDALKAVASSIPTPTPTPTKKPTPTPTPLPPPPVISSISDPVLVGGSFQITGSNFTNGSVANFFVATATGAVNFGPLNPALPHSGTLMTVAVSNSIPLGQGFVAVQVINMDRGWRVSNTKSALLQGQASAGFPTIKSINGKELAGTSRDASYATNNVETVVPQGTVVQLGGTGFDAVHGVAVDLFCAGGKVGPFYINPDTPGTSLSATQVSFMVPAKGQPNSPPTGPGSFVVSNPGTDKKYSLKSNAVSVPIGDTISVTSVIQTGATITVNGTGFSKLTVINFFNTQPGGVMNLGGLKPDGKPRIALTLVSDTKLIFAKPAGALPGASYVQALNPPFVPYTSSGNAGGGAFTLIGFTPTGNMTSKRVQHTATLLTSGPLAGQVLMAGSGGAAGQTAELYNPATVTFTATGNMTASRSWHTATLLTSGPSAGQVLIVGGFGRASAELYNPSTGTFTLSGSMSTARAGHTSTLFISGPLAGQVLIAGGYNSSTQSTLASAELYNPSTRSFSATGSMNFPRWIHTATLLTTGPLAGQVLITGGFSERSYTAELYNPSTRKFTLTGNMMIGRAAHTATLFTSGPLAGQVLIAGGPLSHGGAEIYSPSTGTFTATGSMITPRAYHRAVLLISGPYAGQVLITGGLKDGGSPLPSAELYNPSTEVFSAIGNMTTPREEHTATLLTNGPLAGLVLIAGGNGASGALDSAEVF